MVKMCTMLVKDIVASNSVQDCHRAQLLPLRAHPVHDPDGLFLFSSGTEHKRRRNGR